MIVEILIFTVVVLITSLYFNYRERVEYFSSFKRRGIPGPEPTLFLGNFSEFKKIPNRNITIERWAKTYGEVVGYFLGRKRYIMLTDLDMINNVFIKNVKLFYNREDFALDAKYLIDSVLALKNDRWAKVRRILTPIFSYSKVYQSKAFESEIHSAVMELKKELVRKINEGNLIDLKGEKSAEIDAYKLMQSFTVDVISRTSFALEEKVYEPDNHLVAIVSEYFQFAGNILVTVGALIPVLRSLLTFVNNHLSSGRLIDMMTVRLKEHINVFLKSYQNNDANGNVLNETDKTLSDAVDTKSNLNRAKVLVSLMKKLAEKEITEHEFIGNILLILLAGYETTANAITYVLYALANHPEIQDKLRAEVIKEGIESKYLEMVWYENLRYYPPVTFFVTRKAGEDCIINGVQFLKDDIVQAPVWLVHRDPTYWPEPEVFRPERFEPEERAKHHPCQFLTFGIGQKACLGLNFANYEAKLLLINILKEFKIETCKETPNPLDFIVPTVINNPSTPVVLKFTKIESNE